MQWKTAELIVDGRRVEALRSPVISGKESLLEFTSLSEKKVTRADALFIRWIPVGFRPLDDKHPDHGFVCDDDADQHELWFIKNCGLEESLRVAFFSFSAPAADTFRDPTFSRDEIVTFLNGLSGFNYLKLTFVADSHLSFSFSLVEKATKQEIFSQITNFKRRYFLNNSDSENDNWQWKLFNEDNSFSIGIV